MFTKAKRADRGDCLNQNKLEFGIFIGGATYVDVIPKVTVLTEQLGYDSIWLSDHLFLPPHFYYAIGVDPERKGEYATLESLTTLAAMAGITKKLKLGVGVIPIPMRQPSVLAKQAATIDYISGGRLIFGIGAGWHRREFEAYGIRWDSHKVRIAKMLEGIKVIKKLWTEPFASFEGKYYRLIKAPLWPKPIQKPHPPIWFGGTSLSILDAAAKHGNGWIPYCPSPNEFRRDSAKLKRLLEKYNRKADELTPACVVLAHINSNYEAARKVVEPILKIRGSSTLKAEEWDKAEEHGVYGSPEDCISKIEEYIKAGVKYILFEMMSPKFYIDQIKLFANKVLPAFK